mmetsp:Transcript_44110/g.37019  ORF Transcript_44110/g.37019 Transcript_44110/m.37019 type:complete len:143 (-) Transcript_44110:1271-1699(-)
MSNHECFKSKNKGKQDKDLKEKKKPKTFEELMKSYHDVIHISDFLKQNFLDSSISNTNNTDNNSNVEESLINNFEISVVVIGHVDAGKSTLVGRLMGNILNELNREFDKYLQQAKMINKTSFAYAWNTDGMLEERERGITID